MKKHLIACGLAVLTLGATVLAQTPPAPKPGPEHKALEFFAGKWTTTGEFKPGPLGPGGKMSSADTCEWFSGGFSVVCRGEAKSPMGSMNTLGIVSYDAEQKQYTYYAIDSMGMGELSTGNKSGDIWTFGATSRMGGQTFKSRYTMSITSPTTYTFKWETSPDGSKWVTMMEGKATKGPKGTY